MADFWSGLMTGHQDFAILTPLRLVGQNDSTLSRNYAVDQVDLKQPVESIELASPARNTFWDSSGFLSSLHLNTPHLSTSDCIVPA